MLRVPGSLHRDLGNGAVDLTHIVRRKLDGGRSNILLQGVREFQIRRHLFERSYREAEVTWLMRNRVETLPPELSNQLADRVQRVLGIDQDAQVSRLLGADGLGDERMVNYFSCRLDLAALDKQGLLEERTLVSRTSRLIEVLDFTLATGRLAGSGPASEHLH